MHLLKFEMQGFCLGLWVYKVLYRMKAVGLKIDEQNILKVLLVIGMQ